MLLSHREQSVISGLSQNFLLADLNFYFNTRQTRDCPINIALIYVCWGVLDIAFFVHIFVVVSEASGKAVFLSAAVPAFMSNFANPQINSGAPESGVPESGV